ncbi:MAG: hypothetical protein EOR16_30205 [Mesorhizobium sp.]|uniref:VirE2 family protein n=1 Tax=Mesorhizobium sp. TaxID=1871066 RepID=UPI000FE885B6|nr:hypothetical protein [Mesorhizobium sp.]RWI50534.1 MAG: hypothetical protein EOR16_30205 [Mesorhizobium sp.]
MADDMDVDGEAPNGKSRGPVKLVVEHNSDLPLPFRRPAAKKIRDDAWVIFADREKPVGFTLTQWKERRKRLPTLEEFRNNSYLMHVSLTGNDDLRLKNGEWPEHDYLTPQGLKYFRPLTEDQQNVLNRIADPKERDTQLWYFKHKNYEKLAAEIGIPPETPTHKGKYEAKDAFFNTTGGGKQFCPDIWENPGQAGYKAANFQIWVGNKLEECHWHVPDGKNIYTDMTLEEAQKEAVRKYGPRAAILLKAPVTNRLIGTKELNDRYGVGADQEWWRKQVRQQRRPNEHFSNLTVVLGQENWSVKWLMEKDPKNDLIQDLKDGVGGEYLRVITSGGGRTTIFNAYGEEKFSDQQLKPHELARRNALKALLREAKLPETLALADGSSRMLAQEAGSQLPWVSVPKGPHRDGPPPNDENIMKRYPKDQIMVANVGKNGKLTGMQRTLADYEREGLQLPEIAAAKLALSPTIFSENRANKAPGRYNGQYNDRNDRSRADAMGF